MSKIDFSAYYQAAAMDAGFEVVPDPSGETDYSIFRAIHCVRDSGLCDTPDEAWRACCELINLEVDFQVDPFTKGFIDCALSIEMDETDEEGGEPLINNHDISNISFDSMETIINECAEFQAGNKIDLDLAYKIYQPDPGVSVQERAGHDFMLTRKPHSSGYWDRDLGDVGDRLASAADQYGHCGFYIGDDLAIHVTSSHANKTSAKP